ncbi:MAG TPA: hypothetical protein VFI79_06975 [Gemmatimonadales bacterium]|nr:hypothetical protein [Gemmatimonadales bacterium]
MTLAARWGLVVLAATAGPLGASLNKGPFTGITAGMQLGGLY